MASDLRHHGIDRAFVCVPVLSTNYFRRSLVLTKEAPVNCFNGKERWILILSFLLARILVRVFSVHKRMSNLVSARLAPGPSISAQT